MMISDLGLQEVASGQASQAKNENLLSSNSIM